MDDSDNDLLFAGLLSGVAVGVLATLLLRRRGATVEPPPFESGLELRARPDDIVRRAGEAAGAAVARAREEAGRLLGRGHGVGPL